MANAKKIKNLTHRDLDAIAYVVGSPSPPAPVLLPHQVIERKPIWEILLKLGEIDGGTYVPNCKNPCEIILKNSEWNTLKDCFSSAGYPSMIHAAGAELTEDKIKEADDYNEADNP